MLLFVFQCDDWGARSASSSRVDAIVKDGDALVDRLGVLDYEARVRDSMMMGQVEVSLARIEELTKLREMTRADIVKLLERIEGNKAVIDNLKKDMLVW
jgi:hypothetical protein